ncbi:3-carboxy-cis,cis-muconate cycloisomerase [Saccharopolyspora taberi]|uniref:3-carboxy-cis,cis-muconate cycloisomerase n=1 Tax=Saccharopolyspora taberi TaxID=60895 RepID=A0ABN3VAE9_9PSEU
MPTPGTDAGLLAPTWAGVPAAAALSDEAWLQAMLDVEVALARAQAGLGVIPQDAVPPITAAARAGRLDLAGLAVRARQAANPVVGLVGALVAEVATESKVAAEYVHRGGTSQDVLDTAMMLLARDALDGIVGDLRTTASAFAELARRHRGDPVAGRTLTQHAVPTTFGLKAAGWLNLVLDAVERLSRVRRELPAQLGGAAGTLASYAEYTALPPSARAGEDPARLAVALVSEFAAEVGLAEPVVPWHALRTPVADLGAALAFTTGALGKFAIDVQGAARTEVAELAEPAEEGRGASSAMPQKRNPVLATLVISAARQVPALTSVLAASMVAEDERAPGAWHAEWQPLRESLRLTAGAAATAAELAAGLQVDTARMRQNLDLTGGTIVAERLGARLAPLIGKSEAKRLLTRIAHAAAEGQGTFDELLAKAPELEAVSFDDLSPAELLRPEGYLGAAERLVDRALQRYEKTTA